MRTRRLTSGRSRRGVRAQTGLLGEAARRRRAADGACAPVARLRARASGLALRQVRRLGHPRTDSPEASCTWASRGGGRGHARAAWIDGQRTTELLAALNRVRVSAGDALYIPAGTPHSIGEGVFLIEVQEPTDLSVILEWEGFAIDAPRVGHLSLGLPDGTARGRPLGVDAGSPRRPAGARRPRCRQAALPGVPQRPTSAQPGSTARRRRAARHRSRSSSSPRGRASSAATASRHSSREGTRGSCRTPRAPRASTATSSSCAASRHPPPLRPRR